MAELTYSGRLVQYQYEPSRWLLAVIDSHFTSTDNMEVYNFHYLLAGRWLDGKTTFGNDVGQLREHPADSWHMHNKSKEEDIRQSSYANVRKDL